MVRWRGQSAVYTSAERLIMADLPVREQAFVHTLKALTDGEIGESRGTPYKAEVVQADRPLSPPRPGLNSSVQVGGPGPIYTDPEELEFGKPKRRPKIYALVCTWKQSCVVPTKREGEFWMKVWKAWYERQGWKVKTHDTGYFAAKGEERHSIGLDEYDRDTKERLK